MQLKREGFLYHLFDVLLNIVIIGALVMAIRTFLVAPFEVDGLSMVNTLHDGEYIIINKLVYFVDHPQRGDIVVFRPPDDPGKYYVKRVIGVPGDVVTIEDGYVYVQAEGENTKTKLDEVSYLTERNLGHTYASDPPGSPNTTAVRYEVPEGKFFLLGDNRMGSHDSRAFLSVDLSHPDPYVPEQNIKGKVWFVALPIDKIHALMEPSY